MTHGRYTLIATGIVVGALAASILYDHRAQREPAWWDFILAALGAVS